ncbi:ATP-binding protein [Pseudooceanicola sp. C21-150M6]|uniref:ATP-binding protein n=1 Tax=Pseudooceanicola sp. C21-150M6 TaxID=3434355 RepID=UPI003D7F994B
MSNVQALAGLTGMDRGLRVGEGLPYEIGLPAHRHATRFFIVSIGLLVLALILLLSGAARPVAISSFAAGVTLLAGAVAIRWRRRRRSRGAMPVEPLAKTPAEAALLDALPYAAMVSDVCLTRMLTNAASRDLLGLGSAESGGLPEMLRTVMLTALETAGKGAPASCILDLPGQAVSARAGPVEDGRYLWSFTPVADDMSPKTGAEHGDWDRFENLPVPLLRLNADGYLQKANARAVAMIGPACRAGVHLGELTEGLGRPISDWLDEAASGYRLGSPEFLRVTSSERETFVQITLELMQEGEDVSLLAVLHDATELKTLEAQFVQSQKMHAIGQLAGGVAHDFNNLLTAISGHCDLLLLRHDQGDQDFADLMQITQNANRAAALVNQLLAFSRKQTLRPVEIDLRETVSDLTHLLNRLVGEKITLSFSHDPMLNAIRADKRQLEQVLMNLVVNARDAITGRGEIRIITEGLRVTETLHRDRATLPPGDYVTVKVVDTGSGISPDKIAKVFEPFFTTKRLGEGTGLGLSTAYGIVKQSGGYIFVDSTVGEGTSFTLVFRAYVRPSHMIEPAQPIADPASARFSEGVILLVEDEAPVRAFAARALKLRGYTVLEADSGEAALDVLSDPELKVDVFVTDVVMPGLDGPSWVQRALKSRPGVQVIFVSGYAEDHFGDHKMQVPHCMFLPKPFSLSELTRAVQDAQAGVSADALP